MKKLDISPQNIAKLVEFPLGKHISQNLPTLSLKEMKLFFKHKSLVFVHNVVLHILHKELERISYLSLTIDISMLNIQAFIY
jgi:hypothetical protein